MPPYNRGRMSKGEIVSETRATGVRVLRKLTTISGGGGGSLGAKTASGSTALA